MNIKNMKISQKGINLIKQFEGVRLNAYLDPVGVWTIGYGHTKGVYSGMVISQGEADDLLRVDIESHVFRMKQIITSDINQNQFDALASFCFNLGAYILDNDQELLRQINTSDWKGTTVTMLKYCYGGGVWLQGLYNRRVAETNLFNEGVPTKPSENTGGKIKMKTIKLNGSTNLRTGASTSSSIIATLPPNSEINFDDIVVSGGYIWGVQPRGDGSKGYIALGGLEAYGNIS